MTAAFIDRVAQEDETTGRVRRSPDIMRNARNTAAQIRLIRLPAPWRRDLFSVPA